MIGSIEKARIINDKMKGVFTMKQDVPSNENGKTAFSPRTSAKYIAAIAWLGLIAGVIV
jgi:hypothetical protein